MRELFVLFCVALVALDTCNATINVKRVKYYLYSKSGRREQLSIDSIDILQKSAFNPQNPTRILIHGYLSDQRSDFNVVMVNAYLRHPAQFNVIVVDWGSWAFLPYMNARYELPNLSIHIARFIVFLGMHGNLNLKTTQLVGHSLGAHMAGLIGKRLHSKLAAIVGLDPAKPLFDLALPDERLSYDDAKYVEVIHTGIDLWGFSDPIGRTDFYPNWGSRQFGCGINLAGICSHFRAVEFFAMTIERSYGILSTRCQGGFGDIQAQSCQSDGIAHMGGEPLLRTRDLKKKMGGVFYVSSNDVARSNGQLRVELLTDHMEAMLSTILNRILETESDEFE